MLCTRPHDAPPPVCSITFRFGYRSNTVALLAPSRQPLLSVDLEDPWHTGELETTPAEVTVFQFPARAAQYAPVGLAEPLDGGAHKIEGLRDDVSCS